MRICIVGSRSIDKAEVVFPLIDKFIREHTTAPRTVLSGGAKGVDSLVKEWTKVQGYDFIEFQPIHMLDRNIEFNSKYFFVRNRQLIDNSDIVLAIWDGQSTGTKHSITYAQKKGVPVMVVKTGN